MVLITADAARQIDKLVTFYLAQGFVEAARLLAEAIIVAVRRIEADALLQLPPLRAVSFPRPYPEMEQLGMLWIHQHVYWRGYVDRPGYRVLTNVLYDRADLPSQAARNTRPQTRA